MPVAEDPLFDPLTLGPLTLRNRVVMAPLTRSRAGQPGDVPTALNAQYYRQRTSFGLIISEATQVSPQGKGYAFTPGIYSDDQVEGWANIVRGVHQAGGLMQLQLWHVGRISHPALQPEGAQPVAPSAIAPKGAQTFISADSGMVDIGTPRALETDEIPGIIEQYRLGARNAKAAGFDGVQIHAANGYLLDQFLRSGSNQRSDSYGGSIGNRLRLTLEVVEAVSEVFGADRVGIRISPTGTFNDMHDDDPIALYGALARALEGSGLAYVEVVEDSFQGNAEGGRPEPVVEAIRTGWTGRYIANGNYTAAEARARIRFGLADAVSFGRMAIANPDLPQRFAMDGPLNEPDPASFYGGDEHGYTDYLTLPVSIDC